MRTPLILSTSFVEYQDYFDGDIDNFAQVHIFSGSKIISYYFNPENYSNKEVEEYANNLLNKIKERNPYLKQITMFSNNHKYLIAEDSNLIKYGPLLEFNHDNFKYEEVEGITDIYDIIGNHTVEKFFKKAFISIGASELFETVIQCIDTIQKKRDELEEGYKLYREQDKLNPSILIEVYRIERDYKPKKIKEFTSSSFNSFYSLPENQKYIQTDSRTIFIIKDIKTGKILEGSLSDAIESIKYNKWIKRNPPTIELGLIQRMELDNDGPNFISFDDAFGGEDDFEEGDDDYSPDF